MLGRAARSARRCGATRSATSVVAGERGRSPASSMRGGPDPASASRLSTATTCPPARGAPRVAQRAEAAEGAARRSRGRRACASAARAVCVSDCGPRVGARELEQRRGSARVVVRARPGAGVVAVRHHARSRPATGPLTTAITFWSRRVPRPGTDSRHAAVRVGRSNGGQLLPEPGRRARARPGSPGSGRGTASRARARGPRPRRASNAGGSVGAWQRHGLRDREREQQQQRQQDDEERRAVEPGVDRTLERAAPRSPAPPRGGLEGRHRRAIVGTGAAAHARLRRAEPMVDSSTILLVDDEASVRKVLDLPARAGRLHGRPGGRRRGGARALRGAAGRPRRARHHAPEARRARGLQAPARARARCRSSCSPPATTSSTRCSGSSSARTTTSRSRSRSASSARA